MYISSASRENIHMLACGVKNNLNKNIANKENKIKAFMMTENIKRRAEEETFQKKKLILLKPMLFVNNYDAQFNANVMNNMEQFCFHYSPLLVCGTIKTNTINNNLTIYSQPAESRMCTIQHEISDLCDNILAMAEFYGNTTGENDVDSFIEFAYGDGSSDNYNDNDKDDDDDDDDNEDNFIDEKYYYSDEIDYECPALQPCCDKKKKVRLLNTIYKLHTWSYAYRAARKGEWQRIARDRERFQLRIQRTGYLSLNPILESEHRQKIYEKRFANLYNESDSQNEVSHTKPHQNKKRRKKRFCKIGNKHYF